MLLFVCSEEKLQQQAKLERRRSKELPDDVSKVSAPRASARARTVLTSTVELQNRYEIFY